MEATYDLVIAGVCANGGGQWADADPEEGKKCKKHAKKSAKKQAEKLVTASTTPATSTVDKELAETPVEKIAQFLDKLCDDDDDMRRKIAMKLLKKLPDTYRVVASANIPVVTSPVRPSVAPIVLQHVEEKFSTVDSAKLLELHKKLSNETIGSVFRFAFRELMIRAVHSAMKSCKWFRHAVDVLLDDGIISQYVEGKTIVNETYARQCGGEDNLVDGIPVVVNLRETVTLMGVHLLMRDFFVGHPTQEFKLFQCVDRRDGSLYETKPFRMVQKFLDYHYGLDIVFNHIDEEKGELTLTIYGKNSGWEPVAPSLDSNPSDLFTHVYNDVPSGYEDMKNPTSMVELTDEATGATPVNHVILFSLKMID